MRLIEFLPLLPLRLSDCDCGCVDTYNGGSVDIGHTGQAAAEAQTTVQNVGNNLSLKTAHAKVATSGGHANTQPPSKRSSSGADGDYQLVQHEVLYSLSAEYEVSTKKTISSTT